MSETVRSPFPGTFYRRSDPDSEPYVVEGDTVEAGAVVGLVELMKTYYEVKTEYAGRVVRFLVANEGLVEVGQGIVEIGE